MEEGQTTQWPNKGKTTNNYLQNTTHKTISKICGEYPLYQLHFLISVYTMYF